MYRMNESMLYFKTKRLLVSLLIFWNLSTAINYGDVGDRAAAMLASKHLNMADLIHLNQAKTLWLNKTIPQRRVWHLMQSYTAELNVTVSTCGWKALRWSVMYETFDPPNSGKDYNSNNLLHQNDTYNGSDEHIFRKTNVRKGVLIKAEVEDETEDDTSSTAFIHISTEPSNYISGVTPCKMKIFQNYSKNSTSIKWQKLNLTNIEYRIITSTKLLYHRMCEMHHAKFDKLDHSLSMSDAQTEHKYEILNMKLGEKYHVSVFAKFKNSGLSILYSNASFDYVKPKPVSIKDGQPVRGRVMKNNGGLSYRYKVSNRTIPNSSEDILWYVIPCGGGGGVVVVEIRHKKKVIRRQKISGYTKFVINKPIRGHRYVMKITDATRRKIKKFKYVEVFATMRPKTIMLPIPPENLTVFDYTNRNECASEKKPVTIGWSPVQDNASITYCIYVEKIGSENYTEDETKNADQCDVNKSVNTLNYNNTKECKQVFPADQVIITHDLKKLRPDDNYLIRVTAKKPKGRTMFYNSLKFRRNHSCSNN